MNDDMRDFYFKGLLSIAEAINSIDRNLYSWATVKLYYSIFYLLRVSMYSDDVAIIRKKKYYSLKIQDGEIPGNETTGKTHEGTINLFNKVYGVTDFCGSNQIEDKHPYHWMCDLREQINYREREFYEPDCPLFWKDIQSDISVLGLDGAIQYYLDPKNIDRSFNERFAVFALPLNRLQHTRQSLINKGLAINLDSSKVDLLKQLLTFRKQELSCANLFLGFKP